MVTCFRGTNRYSPVTYRKLFSLKRAEFMSGQCQEESQVIKLLSTKTLLFFSFSVKRRGHDINYSATTAVFAVFSR